MGRPEGLEGRERGRVEWKEKSLAGWPWGHGQAPLSKPCRELSVGL